ncbi:MAG TPA: hypothetical protein VKC57_18780, partial [Ktedonobacterales bacterium]|nr:hypothetical protein [Ktedonobacterales bacterium]
VLLLPVAIALGGAGIFLNTDGSVPAWLPFTLLLWLPGLPLLWLALQSVRTSARGVAAGRPWAQWDEIAWEHIERADQRGLLVRLTGSNGERLAFSPLLLRDGRRLERQLLLRLPTHVLTGRLATKAQALLTTGIYSTSEGGYSGTLIVRPRPLWKLLLALATLGCGLGAAFASLRSPPLLAVSVAAGSLALVAGCTLLWFGQRIQIDGNGLIVTRRPFGRKRVMRWSEIELVEHSRRQAVLRLRGRHKLVCAGPGLLTPAQATLLRGFLFENCTRRGVPVLPRSWLWPL